MPKQQAWPQTSKETLNTALTPVTNSVCKRLPLWLGPLPDAERQRREAQGTRVVPLQNLQPWGRSSDPICKEQQGEVLAWLENGSK